jgi:multidrug efflux pump subunit AcrB
MTLPTLCIERPVMTTLLTMAIVLVGSVGCMFLPVAALPQVDVPTIAVSTTLPGASPSSANFFCTAKVLLIDHLVGGLIRAA